MSGKPQKSRLDILADALAKDPENTFARYGIAMEYVRLERLDEGARAFADLVERKPDYVPGWFQGGRTLERLKRVEDARRFYERGIAAAVKVGNQHAREELEAALSMLG